MGDSVVEKLQEVHEGVGEWAPLSYQYGPGMGWSYVSQDLRELTLRLNEDPDLPAAPCAGESYTSANIKDSLELEFISEVTP